MLQHAENKLLQYASGLSDKLCDGHPQQDLSVAVDAKINGIPDPQKKHATMSRLRKLNKAFHPTMCRTTGQALADPEGLFVKHLHRQFSVI